MRNLTRSISFQLTKLGVAVALALGVLVSMVQISLDFMEASSELDHSIEQTLASVKHSATLAAHELDQKLAKQVVDGLLIYRHFALAVIADEHGQILAESVRDQPGVHHLLAELLIDVPQKSFQATLISEVDNQTTIGSLVATVDRRIALSGFFARSYFLFGSGVARNLILMLILLWVYHRLLARPLTTLVGNIRKAPRNEQLSAPPGHDNDELGALVDSINEYRTQLETQRAELETNMARRRYLVDKAADGICIVDGKTRRIEFANERLCRWAGLVAGSQSMRFEELVHAAHRNRLISDWIQLEPDQALTLETSISDGTIEHPVEATITCAQVGDRQMVYVVARDISLRRQLERQLAHAQKMEAIGQLTGGIAHDFNNLLQIILAQIDLLTIKQPQNWDEAAPMLASARKASLRGAQLTGQLLSFSRKQTLNPECVDLGPFLEQAIVMWSRTLGEDIVLRFKQGHPEPLVLEVDASALENALLNIALNARAAMPQGGELTLATDRVQILRPEPLEDGTLPCGDYARITITDTGAGMPPEVLAKVFEPFFTTKDIGQGSGLGLSMVYGFVRQSGGRIQISSEPGGGTQVEMLLPLNRERPEKLSPPAAQPGAETATYDGRHVLLVEDEAEVREVLTRQLHQLGFHVHPAERPTIAMELLAANPEISLLISDIIMPGGTHGVEFALEAKHLRPDLAILLMSGHADDRLGGIRGPHSQFTRMHKPFTFLELCQAIDEEMNRALQVSAANQQPSHVGKS